MLYTKLDQYLLDIHIQILDAIFDLAILDHTLEYHSMNQTDLTQDP